MLSNTDLGTGTPSCWEEYFLLWASESSPIIFRDGKNDANIIENLFAPSLAKIVLTFILFILSSYLWRMVVVFAISDTFPWGFPLQFYLAWGPCPPGQVCSESHFFYLIIDILFWYMGSALLILSFNRKPKDEP
jgi:hypothetical protein